MPGSPHNSDQSAVRRGPLSWTQGHQSCRQLFAATPLLAGVMALLAALGLVGAVMPSTAAAYATVASPPTYSTASGLPDGRVYEQVSPTDKNGNEAGVGTNQHLGAKRHYALAAPDGNSVVFEGTGAMGEATAAYDEYFIAHRSADGWSTTSVLPRPLQPDKEFGGGTLDQLGPRYLDMSEDLSHVMFEAKKGSFATPPDSACGYNGVSENQIYLGLSSPTSLDTWLERPEITDPIEACEEYGLSGAPVGGSPNFRTAYFTYPGTFLPEDASRSPHAHGVGEEGNAFRDPWGFYEDREGVLRDAGVLPDGSLDPFGAVPAASGHGRAIIGNQVSTDGSRAFFVSPDPDSCGRGNDCTTDPPELYVRENGEKTLLVSRDALLPEDDGLPVPAPTGVSAMPNPARQVVNGEGSYVFASPDGSQAFFESQDDLTTTAEEASTGLEPKMYDFDVDTGSLTYLPHVAGQIVTSNQSGSTFAFVDSSASPAELALWSAGPDGGTVTSITQLPGDETVSSARMPANGAVLVFLTSARLPDAFNSGGFRQVYRYEASSNMLGCVSCPPAGVTPSGNADMSTLQANEVYGVSLVGLVDERGVSSDGSRIFFDTPDPLVPQDANTKATEEYGEGEPHEYGRDVYEWENGTIYLLSSGKSSQSSYFLDNSENGSDAFFATAESLSPGDTDGAYDVYDARIPRPGETPPPAAVPCEGSVCQGPPRVPTPLAAPASATFSGVGDTAPVGLKPAANARSERLTNGQRLSMAIKACKKEKKTRRVQCEAQARRKYAPKGGKSTRRDK
jgi:hypothetical protein